MRPRFWAWVLFALACAPLPGQRLVVHLSDGGVRDFALDEVDSIVYAGAEPHYDTPRGQLANLTLDIRTDSACYHPGAVVTFTLPKLPPSSARVRYMHLGRVLREEPLRGRTWQWQTPREDYRGYMVQVYVPGAKAETVRGTVAVDVSSDWRRFPRYGFVATFDQSKDERTVAAEMDWLMRCHINGVQFQDWHYKHHWPWGGKGDEVYESYTDIANRTIVTGSVRNYIAAQHARGMRSMFYNLCYGALDDAEADGVRAAWFLYRDAAHRQRDRHELPDSWKSDIYLVDPSETGWQYYLHKRNEEVYAHLDFDGFQIDQLGDRGSVYRSTGAAVNLPLGYFGFLRYMKSRRPGKRLVMNAVSGYGSPEIARSGAVDFLYNEVWADEGGFDDLYNILLSNARYGADTLQTVFAAYMNYGLSGGEFNAGGVLLTDAVMFALGASHLELGGDHMLCREYFPYAGLTMTAGLKTQLTRYYDFLTAYENLLRGAGRLDADAALAPVCLGATPLCGINAWPPRLGGVTSIARRMPGRTVVHLLNFVKANSLSWRDADGTMPAAQKMTDIPLQFTWSGEVRHVYVASPDTHGGAMQELPFRQEDGRLTLTLPLLAYWTMLVIE